MESADFCVKYPFSKKAKELLETSQLQLSDLIIENGLVRIKNALEGRIPKSSAIHDSEKVEEVASYAAARMILGYMKNRYLTNRFAVGEAKRASSYLRGEDNDIIDAVAGEFGITTVKEGSTFFIPLPAFLKYSPRSIDYKLSNRSLKSGLVELKQSEKIRLVEEAVRKKAEKIPLVKNPSDSIKNAAEQLKEELPKLEPARMVSFVEGDNPPCIEKLLEQLKKHENLNHQARWTLAVYLTKRGMELEKINSLYSNLPDFNEKITRYQLEHIRKRDYSMPSCATMLTYGLCCADCRIGSPLNWQPRTQGGKK